MTMAARAWRIDDPSMPLQEVTKYSASAEATHSIEWRCAYCGCAGRLTVTDTSRATNTVGGWDHAQGFQRDQLAGVHHRAYHQALQQAKETARIAPCPRCGRRPGGGVARYFFTYALITSVLLAVGGALGASVFVLDWSFVAGLFGLATTAFAVGLAVICIQGYRDARTKAVFTELA
jgi:hypothetical protein